MTVSNTTPSSRPAIVTPATPITWAELDELLNAVVMTDDLLMAIYLMGEADEVPADSCRALHQVCSCAAGILHRAKETIQRRMEACK